ncbi:HAD-IB family phosphatase [Lysobacter sp. D1-1-M9]
MSGVLVRRAIVRFGYCGVPLSTLEAMGQDFARSYLPSTLRPEEMQRIAWHKARGHKVVVVSGGLDVYLAPWCQEHGLELICSSLRHFQGVLTGHYLGEQCVLAEKARRVHEQYDLSLFPTIYAYGDTPEDTDLLGLASKRYYQWQEVDAAVGL